MPAGKPAKVRVLLAVYNGAEHFYAGHSSGVESMPFS